MKIRPAENHIHESYSDRSIARDDLDFILERLKTEGLTIQLSDDDFLYETLEEILEQRGPQPRKLAIDAKNPEAQASAFDTLTIILTQRVASVHIWGQGKSKNAAQEVLTHLRNTPDRVPRWIRPFPAYWAALIAVNIELWSVLVGAFRMSPFLHAVMASVIVAWPISIVYSSQAPGLFLHRRHQNFWQRNRDNLLLLLIGAIIGGFFTYVLNLATK